MTNKSFEQPGGRFREARALIEAAEVYLEQRGVVWQGDRVADTEHASLSEDPDAVFVTRLGILENHLGHYSVKSDPSGGSETRLWVEGEPAATSRSLA